MYFFLSWARSWTLLHYSQPYPWDLESCHRENVLLRLSFAHPPPHFFPSTPLAADYSKHTKKSEMWRDQSFHLLVVAYMKSLCNFLLEKRQISASCMELKVTWWSWVQAKECLKNANFLEESKCKYPSNDEVPENAKTLLSHWLESWAWTESTISASMHLWLALSFDSLQAGNLERTANLYSVHKSVSEIDLKHLIPWCLN